MFWNRFDRSASTEELVELVDYLLVDLRSGLSWSKSLAGAAEHFVSRNLRSFCTSLHRSREMGAEIRYSNLHEEFLASLIFSLGRGGEYRLTEGLEAFRRSLLFQSVLTKKVQSYSFLPRAQAATSILLSSLIAFTSFQQIVRVEILIAGSIPILVGIGLVFFISSRPLSKRKNFVRELLFFESVSILLNCGHPISEAWLVAQRIFMPSLNSWSFRSEEIEFRQQWLESFFRNIKRPWCRFGRGLCHLVSRGQPIGSFLERQLKDLLELELIEWELDAKKYSYLALIPLYFGVFPGCLILAIGPQVL